MAQNAVSYSKAMLPMSFATVFTQKCTEELIHRIIESLRLEKTSKIIKSNCQTNSAMPHTLSFKKGLEVKIGCYMEQEMIFQKQAMGEGKVTEVFASEAFSASDFSPKYENVCRAQVEHTCGDCPMYVLLGRLLTDHLCWLSGAVLRVISGYLGVHLNAATALAQE